MNELFTKYDISLFPEQQRVFENFLKLFIETNSQINLSAIRDDEGIIEKHFIDSIMLLKYCSVEGKILDLWTGWGFPGIPLRIMTWEDADYTLVDSIGKKVKVVNTFISSLWLKNITALQARAEDLWQDPKHREQYQFITSRATAYLPTLLEYTLPLLKIWGIFASYKLDNDTEIKEARKALNILWGEIIKIEKYTLAWQERIFLFIQKVAPSPKKYPRTIGEPLKTPLQ